MTQLLLTETPLDRARHAAAQTRKALWYARLADALAATATPRCRCNLTADLTRDDLRALGAGCSSPHYVCPRLDTIRRRLGA